MRAAVLTDSGLSVRDWETPEPGPGEARVALTKVGICGSDVHFAIDGGARTAFRPIVLGHEPAGRLDCLGPGTTGPEVGSRVAIVPIVTCGVCARCRAGRTVICASKQVLGTDRHGCWADYVVVPVANLLPIPPGLPDELAAVATDAVATAYHAAVTRGGIRAGSRVVVWGAGGLGVSAVGIARARGAGFIAAVDPRADARRRAQAAGADLCLGPEGAIDAIAQAGGVDVALELVGSPETLDAAVRCLDDGGRAVAVGLGRGGAVAGGLISFVTRERELVGALGAEPSEVAAALELLGTGALALPDLVAGEIPLADVADGLERVHRGELGGARLVVDVDGSRR
jgi:threonine dehydrogenase-like Zn-dependent dehydrogenase